MEDNLAYGSCGEVAPSTHLPTPSHVHQQQDMELTQNQAYICTATSIPVETNQCYGTTTPSVGPDQLYATVEEGNSSTHGKQQQMTEEYDYAIPK